MFISLIIAKILDILCLEFSVTICEYMQIDKERQTATCSANRCKGLET